MNRQIEKVPAMQVGQNPAEIDPEYIQELIECFIKPLEDMGFVLQSYTHNYSDAPSFAGLHMLLFEHESALPPYPKKRHKMTAEWTKQIAPLMRDNDTGPVSTFGLRGSTLWIFIPYTY